MTMYGMRIRWSDTEKEQIAIAMANALFKDVHLNYRDAFERAQKKVLPVGRQRNIVSLEHGAPWLKRMVEDEIAKLRAQSTKEAEKTGLTNTPLPELMSTLIERIVNEAVAKAIDSTTSTVMERLQPQILEEVERRVNQALDSFTAPVQTEVVKVEAPNVGVQTSKKTAHRRLPTVVVVGPLQSQMNHIALALDGMAKLKFIDKEDTPSRVKAASRKADHVVGMTRFLSHSHESAIRSVVDMNVYNRFDGGVTRLASFIKGLVANDADVGATASGPAPVHA